MPTQQDVSTQLVQALKIAIPDLDTTIGQPVRSILDVVAEVVAEAYGDQYLLSYQYDIYTKSGADLDSFVQMFGITRHGAARATGVVTLSRTTPAPHDIFIAQGSQLSTNTSPPVVFSTIVPVTLAHTSTSVSVPVQALVAGANGNVVADSIVSGAYGFSGVSAVTNTNPCTGGTDPESDDQLRTRFIATVFRSLTGTEAMFLACALNNPSVTQANVIGATKTYVENIAIATGKGISSVTDFAYLYPQTTFLGPNIFAGEIYSPVTDFTISLRSDTATVTSGSDVVLDVAIRASDWGIEVFGTGIPPHTYVGTVTPGVSFLLSASPTQQINVNATATASSISLYQPVITALTVPDGIYQLQYDYLPSSSRNDPTTNINNRIDIWLNGTSPMEVVQNTTFSNVALFQSTDPAGDYYYLNFVRTDGTHPTPGHIFIQYGFSPVTTPAYGTGTIQIGATIYTEGSDFWLVNDDTAFGYAPFSQSGIEFGGTATPGTPMTLTYLFNQIPQTVQKAIQNWRLVGTDVWVHQAKYLDLNVYLGLVLASINYSTDTILSQIETTISNYLSSLSFNQTVQVSQILALVQAVPGVSAVRFLNDADSAETLKYGSGTLVGDSVGTYFAIQSMNGTSILNTYASDVPGQVRRAVDVTTGDDTLVALNGVYFNVFTTNTFGPV